MKHVSIEKTPKGAGMPPQGDAHMAPEGPSCIVYISLELGGAFKAGTCEHCVVYEHGRPPRAWDADGDRDLDFARDRLFAELAELGIVFTNRQAYICP